MHSNSLCKAANVGGCKIVSLTLFSLHNTNGKRIEKSYFL